MTNSKQLVVAWGVVGLLCIVAIGHMSTTRSFQWLLADVVVVSAALTVTLLVTIHSLINNGGLMPTALRVFLQILTLLVASFIVTTSVGFLNKPSDMAVLFGVFGLCVAVYLLWYATKYIWRNFTLTTKGSK